MNSEGSEAEDNQAVASGFEGHENELDSSPTMTDDVKDNGVKEEGDSEKNIEKDNQSYDKKPSASNSFESEEEAPETVRGKEVPPSEIPVPPVHEQKPKKKKVKRAMKYCKAPQAPKRFKSAFIFFTMARHGEIRKKLEAKGAADKTPDVAKIISEEWRNMPPKERAVWDEKAKIDKERYEIEKSMYTGPWKIPSRKRSQKDPEAPKRPMSSFLAFSNGKRSDLKKKNPSMTNTDISKLLAKMWKGAPDEEKKEYIEKESKLREIYKKDMAAWKEKIRKEQLEEEVQKEKLAKELMSTTSISAGAAAAAAELSTRGGNISPEKVLEAARLQQQAVTAGFGDLGGGSSFFGMGGDGLMNRGFPQDFGGQFLGQDQFAQSGYPPHAGGYNQRMMEFNNHYRMIEMQQQMAQMAEYEQRYNQYNQSMAGQQFSQGYPGGNREWHMNGASPNDMLQQRTGLPIDPPGNNAYGAAFPNTNPFSDEDQLAHLLRRRQQKQHEQEQLEHSSDPFSNKSSAPFYSNGERGIEPQGSSSHEVSRNSPSLEDRGSSTPLSPTVSHTKSENGSL